MYIYNPIDKENISRLKLDELIILIVGRSGSGKSTLARKLCDEYGFKEIQSYTTRKPRYEGETGHIFIDEDEHYEICLTQKVVADTFFDDNYYFSTDKQINECGVYVVDYYGVKSFIERYDGIKKPIVVLLELDDAVSLERMIERGDNAKNIAKRYLNDVEAEHKNDSISTICEMNDIPYTIISTTTLSVDNVFYNACDFIDLVTEV